MTEKTTDIEPCGECEECLAGIRCRELPLVECYWCGEPEGGEAGAFEQVDGTPMHDGCKSSYQASRVSQHYVHAAQDPEVDAMAEKALCLETEALTAGMSDGQIHCESVRRAGCGEPDAEECPRGGWILSDFDTWEPCGIHGPSERHPEDAHPED